MLSHLSELSTIYIEDMFGFSGEDFPNPKCFPALQLLDFESIPKEAGMLIRKAYKNKVREVSITKLRTIEWLKENLNYPLRHWEGSEFVPKSKAKKAKDIYNKTRREIMVSIKQYQQDLDITILKSTIFGIIKDYGLAFNKLNGRTYFIETQEREDIFMALEYLFKEIKEIQDNFYEIINIEKLIDILDDVRDW